MHHDTLLRLIGSIYDAATASSRWTALLAELSQELGADAAVLHFQHTSPRQHGRIMTAVGMPPASQQGYDEHYASVNIWTVRGRQLLTEGAVLTGQMVCADREVERSEYYNDYLKRMDLFHSIAAVPFQQRFGSLVLASLRAQRRGAFDAEEVKLLSLLTPHLRRAVQVHHRLQELQQQSSGISEMMDKLAAGVVLLSESGRVLFANVAARHLALAADGFHLRAEGPAASWPADTRALHKMIAAAADPLRRGGGILRLSRPSQRTPLMALVTPLTNPTPLELGERWLVGLFVSDPEGGLELSLPVLQTAYGLAPAEALTARSLCRGATLQEIAVEQGHTIATTRWYVKQILQKVGVDSQVALVRQLIMGPAAIALSPDEPPT